jgi:hypothetical protein
MLRGFFSHLLSRAAICPSSRCVVFAENTATHPVGNFPDMVRQQKVRAQAPLLIFR